jgi:hypothetical protein
MSNDGTQKWQVPLGRIQAIPEDSLSVEELRRLAAWWRQCSGTEQFKQGADWCAAQLDLALDGRRPGVALCLRCNLYGFIDELSGWCQECLNGPLPTQKEQP